MSHNIPYKMNNIYFKYCTEIKASLVTKMLNHLRIWKENTIQIPFWNVLYLIFIWTIKRFVQEWTERPWQRQSWYFFELEIENFPLIIVRQTKSFGKRNKNGIFELRETSPTAISRAWIALDCVRVPSSQLSGASNQF